MALGLIEVWHRKNRFIGMSPIRPAAADRENGRASLSLRRIVFDGWLGSGSTLGKLELPTLLTPS